MSRNAVATLDMINFLERIGFVQLRTGKGRHAVYRHEATGLVVTLPTGDKDLPPISALAIQKQLDNFNIVPEEKFDKMLRAANKFEKMLRAAS
jgi:predicted RNA binding protein YcfA (HicA-like mRNA interferase family)